MPKFGTTDEPIAKPAMDEIPPATKGAGAVIPTTYIDSTPRVASAPVAPHLSEAAQLAAIELEKKKWEANNSKQNEDWMVKKWRPMMGWTYMLICILDMAIFPIMWSVVQVVTKSPLVQWNPLTLQGGGLFHIAMGAVLGISAWSRGQEKIYDATNRKVE
jgi:Holin of 3TMs, for gene-transfer release